MTPTISCRNCGDPVDPDRVTLGYDYCLKDDCQARCLEPIVMARVGLNKAADQFVRADEVVSTSVTGTRPVPPAEDDDDEPGITATSGRSHRPPPARRRRPPGAGERLERAGARLDVALEASYDRFARGITTAREMNIERNKLIRAFNGLVRAENIRYRSMLRREFPVDG